ncbi:MAG TPA: hypothetical protein VGF55_00970, partial [Gemmataceae bacterium]
MPFTLEKAFSPTYKLAKPVEDATSLKISPATWDSAAVVLVTNEPGRRFKVGFVQVLLESNLVATYEHHTLSRDYNDLPILDSDPGMFPWYESHPSYSPEKNGNNGTVRFTAKMSDTPSSGVRWHAKDVQPPDPLVKVYFRKKFRTWLAVRDVTAPPLANTFETILSQFDYVIEATHFVD